VLPLPPLCQVLLKDISGKVKYWEQPFRFPDKPGTKQLLRTLFENMNEDSTVELHARLLEPTTHGQDRQTNSG
jgi:hypothetical protein